MSLISQVMQKPGHGSSMLQGAKLAQHTHQDSKPKTLCKRILDFRDEMSSWFYHFYHIIWQGGWKEPSCDDWETSGGEQAL